MHTLEQQLKIAQDRYTEALKALRALNAASTEGNYLVEAHRLAGAHHAVCRLTNSILKRDRKRKTVTHT